MSENENPPVELHLSPGWPPVTVTVRYIDDDYVLAARADGEGPPLAFTRAEFDAASNGPPQPPKEWWMVMHQIEGRGWVPGFTACDEADVRGFQRRWGTWICKMTMTSAETHFPQDS